MFQSNVTRKFYEKKCYEEWCSDGSCNVRFIFVIFDRLHSFCSSFSAPRAAFVGYWVSWMSIFSTMAREKTGWTGHWCCCKDRMFRYLGGQIFFDHTMVLDWVKYTQLLRWGSLFFRVLRRIANAFIVKECEDCFNGCKHYCPGCVSPQLPVSINFHFAIEIK